MTTLIMMAKSPQPGAVKTRMMPDLSAAECAQLQEACIRDWLQRPLPRFDNKVVAISGPDHPVWDTASSSGWTTTPQHGPSLGDRMMNAANGVSGPVVIVGTDSPSLPTSIIDAAVTGLGAHDLVYAPANDGGYTLIAFSGRPVAVMRDIPWGGASVLVDSLSAAKRAGLRPLLLAYWYDVDTIADLRWLRVHSRSVACETMPHIAQNTLSWIDEIGREL